jgi:hypothetical protein
MAGTRLSTARSKSSFNITPRALARPAFMAIEKLSAAKENIGECAYSGTPKQRQECGFGMVLFAA